jgi:hypothetical protein
MDFYELQKASLILENIAAAKALLVKDYAEKQKKKVNDIPEEIKKSILRDPKFQKILDLVEGRLGTPANPGWAFPLTKFHAVDGAPWEEIISVDDKGKIIFPLENGTGLYNLLFKLKSDLNQLPLKNVDAYARIIPTEGDHRPAYEVLGDDLRAMETKRKLKKIYNELIPRMKKEFDRVAASNKPKDKELIETLELFALALEKLKPRENVETGETEYPLKEFKKKTGMRFSDSPAALDPEFGNPAFKDPEVAFRTLVRECMDLIDNWNLGLDEYTEKIIELGLRAGIFYNRNRYLAMSARTPEAQRAVSGDSNFCINNDSTFWSYGEGSIQLNIINGNLPKANKKYLLGVTIKKDGVVKNCAWKNNTGTDRDFHKSGINYAKFLKELEYPDEMVQKIIDKFDEEVTIKLSLEKFYRDSKGLTPNALIRSLIDIKNGIFNGVVSPEQWDQVSGIVSFIVREERNIPVSDFIKEFKASGIFTVSAWEVFDYVVEGDYTKKDIEEIKAMTLSIMEEMEQFVAMKEKGRTFNIPEANYKKILSAIEYKNENIAKLDALIGSR